ncbi:hypothetical protein BSKO_14166, partial [Bryopsis sp. KO-2023]
RIPTGDQPICGVVLEPYVVFQEQGTQAPVTTSIPDDDDSDDAGTLGRFRLRSRWFRQTQGRNTALCSIHPNKDASIQCVLCLKARVPQNLSYHCNGDCLQDHWHLHRAFHEGYKQQYAGIVYPAGCRNNASNYRNHNGDEDWIEISQRRYYIPSIEDVGCGLKFECCLIDMHAQLYGEDAVGKVVSTHVSRVQPPSSPPIRAMTPVRLPNARIHQEGRFTVLTYNILADLYASQGDMYQCYCPAWALSWHYRKLNLIRELAAYRADVVCLQEVQSNHYEDYFRGAMEDHGYSGVFKRKTNEVFVGKALAIDGCATFYRRDRFTLIKKYEVEFNKAAVSTANQYPEPQRNAALQRLSKDNVALIVVLESVHPMLGRQKQLICVANTHIHANPDHSDVKLWQVHTLLKGLEKIAASAEIPIIVAGDFNSEPGSAAHTLLVMQGIDQTHPETGNDPAQFLRNLLPVQHKLPLRSAYSSMFMSAGESADQRRRLEPTLQEPLFTNCTMDYKGTLHYIFYTPTLLQPTSLLELPSDQEAQIHVGSGLPNARYSSDHICLLAEFQLLIQFSQ